MGSWAELGGVLDGPPSAASHDDVIAVFAHLDRIVAWLTGALDRVDPAADGAITLPQWLRVYARRSGREAAQFTKRATRVDPVVAEAWQAGQLATGQVDAVVANVSDRTAALFAEHAAELVP